MQVSEIGSLAESLYLHERISDNDFLLEVVNLGQRELPVFAFRETTTDITVTGDEAGITWKDLPVDFVQTVEIRQGDRGYTSVYEIRDNKIRFPAAGTYTVHYRKLPAELVTVTQEPEVHQAYHDVLPRYVAGFYKRSVVGDRDGGDALIAEFYATARVVVDNLRPPRRIKAMAWS